ncbi:MAG: type VI secretion system-associated protein TagF [Candidatus Contendobacter sp.]
MSGTTVTPRPSPLAGFFGKLPSRGDFIGRQLPKTFVTPWDTWLQAAIARSCAQMGEDAWREYYCTSPIWRFALGAGLCGADAYTGVLMPSMDRVGRYYPLAIAVPLAPDWPLLALPIAGEAWFQQAERLALAALERDELDLDAFSRQVATLGAPLEPDTPSATATHGNAWYCPLPEPLNLTQAAPALANHLLRRAFSQPSLWWTEGSEWITRCLLICAGLPPTAGFAAMLSGDWQQSGWNEQSFAGVACLACGPSTAEEA